MKLHRPTRVFNTKHNSHQNRNNGIIGGRVAIEFTVNRVYVISIHMNRVFLFLLEPLLYNIIRVHVLCLVII